MRVVSLSLHKNTLEKRRKHTMSASLLASAKDAANDKQVDAYVVIAVKNGTPEVHVETGQMDVDQFFYKIGNVLTEVRPECKAAVEAENLP